MNDPCDLCEVFFDEIKLKLAHQKYETDSEKEALMTIGCHLRKLCPNSHKYLYERLRIKILDKSQKLKEGQKRTMRKTKAFYKKGKGKWVKNSSKQRKNPGQTQSTGFRDRSKSTNRKFSQERSLNRTGSKGNLNSDSSKNTGQRGWSGNRDRSKSFNRKESQERGVERNASRSSSKNKNKNQNHKGSLEDVPSELKFRDELVNKWQTGIEGVNSGIDLEWYGPYFKPKSRSSSLTRGTSFRNSSKSPVPQFSASRHSTTDNRFFHRQNNNNFRTQSLDRIGNNSYSGVGNTTLDGHSAKNFNSSFQAHSSYKYQSLTDISRQQKYSQGRQDCQTRSFGKETNFKHQGFPKQNYSDYKSKHSNSFENVSRTDKYYENHSNSTARNLSLDRDRSVNNHEKNYQRQGDDRESSNYKSKPGKFSGSQPTSRDSSIESRASMFLPKFGSRTSVQNISDNEQE